MRIGYIHLDYGEWTNGSYNAQEIGLAKAYEELGHQTYIVYWLNRKDKRCFTEVKLSPFITKVYLPYRFRLVHHAIVDLNLLEPYQLDLLHLQSDNLLYVPNAVNYCLKRHIPHYCYVGTITSSNSNPVMRSVLDYISRRNIKAFKKTKVFAKTPAMTQTLQKEGVKNAIFAPVGLDLSAIPNITTDKKKLKQMLGIPTDKKIIVCVCALRHDKHPFDIFELAENLNEDYQIVYIGGNGPLKDEFIAKLNEKPAYQIIHYLGQIPNKDIHTYYQIADYTVNFNPNEIFGMAILEAMYHNCTVVAIEAPGPKCIIENRISGFLVPSVSEMANTIKSGAKVQNASQRVLTSFTWKGTAQTFLSYFPELQ